MKIAHFSVDSQFLESVQYSFSKSLPESTNHFYIYSGILRPNISKAKNLENIKKFNFHKVIFFREKDFKKYDLIVFHSLNYWNSKILLKLRTKRYYSIVWGGEIYTNTELKTDFSRNDKYLNSKVSFLRRIYDFIQYGYYLSTAERNKIIAKALFMSKKLSSNPMEFEILKKDNIYSKSATNFIFSYNPIEFMVKKFPKTIKKENIMVIGKSGNVAEDHLPVLKKIHDNLENVCNFKFLMNFSYGDKKYIADILDFLRSFDKVNFKIENEFKKMEDYFCEISKAKFFILNSKRQQGVGNIIAHLFFGTKIYLNDENILLDYFKKTGFKIFSVNDFYRDLRDNKICELDINEKKINKKVVFEQFSLENNRKTLFKILE